jgi:hypothetical protein
MHRVLCLCALACALPLTAAAQRDDSTRATARLLGEQGIKAYMAGDYVEADATLDRAFRLFAVPTLGLWSGRARVKLQHWVEAAERLREAARSSETSGDAAVQDEARRDAREELDALEPKIPLLRITLENVAASSVRVMLDDQPVPSAMIGADRPTDPGPHRITAQRGREHYESRIDLGASEHKRTSFHFDAEVARNDEAAESELQPLAAEAEAPAPSAPAAATSAAPSDASSPLQPIAIVAMSLGAASLATSGITALLANGKRSQCPDNFCMNPGIKTNYDTLRTISTITVYGGGALVIGGLVTYLLAPSSESPAPTVSWMIDPTSAAIRGKF